MSTGQHDEDDIDLLERPAWFQGQFDGERFLWDCATAQLGTEEAVDRLLASGTDGLDDRLLASDIDDFDEYARFLLTERYKSLRNYVRSQVPRATSEGLQQPLEHYERELERIEQKKAAKRLRRPAGWADAL